MKILKFGGSSVGAPERAEQVIAIVKERVSRGEKIALVFSAYEGVTNELLALSDLAKKADSTYLQRLKKLSQRHIDYLKALVPSQDQSRVIMQLTLWLNELEDTLRGVSLVRELTQRSRDQVISLGERLSSFTLAETLKLRGIPSEYLDARTVIRTDETFGNAKVDILKSRELLQAHFATHSALQVITGFIASTATGETTTLGRGGSDYTAAIVGAALDVEEVEIWTDVNGMMTADPRKVPKAFSIPQVSYEEALELCHFGAKVIYTPTLQPAMEQKIPIRILNTFNPSFVGTLITHEAAPSELAVTGVSSIEEIGLLRVQGSGLMGIAGIASRLFSAMARGKINVILITQASSEHSICLAVSPGDATTAKNLIAEEFRLEIQAGLVELPILESSLSIISIVGENMRHSPGTSGKLFQALGKNGINVIAIAQGSSELNISVVIERKDESKALVAVHEAFFLSELRALNLFIAGTGLIGKTLLKQIEAHKQVLQERFSLENKLIGSTNSREYSIGNAQGPSSQFAEALLAQNLPNSVFVDCTASEEVAAHYEKLLQASVAVVTPNKKALSGSQARYQSLKKASQKRGADFLFETCVGAGLPVINTLNDLIRSGDRIIQIEAVLSGTLSFLFNSFCSAEGRTRPFSEIVLEAKQKGYTEPDPRDDLNGLDAARKLLILAREAGFTLEINDIAISKFLPEALFKAGNVAEFLQRLPEADKQLASLREGAQSRNARLCYMGILTPEHAALELKEITADHAFASLSGSDNIIAFTTDRYKQRPLVVKGPGAGAEVTAAGVFADIIRIAR